MIIVVMGVSGAGKTTVGTALASALGWPFVEADDLHSPEHIEKMRRGDPLDDADRAPWLAKVADWVDARLDAGECGVITCSALKHAYRDLIARRGSGVEFVYLHGSPGLIASRLAARQDHFMPASLLDTQFATLEEPVAGEPVLRVEIGATPEIIVANIIDALGLPA